MNFLTLNFNKINFIDIILPIPLQKTFTYSVTEEEANFLQTGMRVAVSFGKTKIYTGLVFNIHQTAPALYEAKEAGVQVKAIIRGICCVATDLPKKNQFKAISIVDKFLEHARILYF